MTKNKQLTILAIVGTLLTSATAYGKTSDFSALSSTSNLLCFKTGEQVSGMNKICYYNCGGSPAAITVKAFKLCPPSINM